jgi:large subunit ribosomal protein L6
MSRIAKYPVAVPDKVQVTVDNQAVTVKGPLGTLKHPVTPQVTVKVDGNQVTFAAANESKEANALSGTLRANVANMVHGVREGFSKKLNLVGVGYRAQAQGNKLNLSLGFSHPIAYALPEGIEIKTPDQTTVEISGIDKQKVGQIAAEIRRWRKPEPYKGKGIKYDGEFIFRKEGKKK